MDFHRAWCSAVGSQAAVDVKTESADWAKQYYAGLAAAGLEQQFHETQPAPAWDRVKALATLELWHSELPLFSLQL